MWCHQHPTTPLLLDVGVEEELVLVVHHLAQPVIGGAWMVFTIWHIDEGLGD